MLNYSKKFLKNIFLVEKLFKFLSKKNYIARYAPLKNEKTS